MSSFKRGDEVGIVSCDPTPEQLAYYASEPSRGRVKADTGRTYIVVRCWTEGGYERVWVDGLLMDPRGIDARCFRKVVKYKTDIQAWLAQPTSYEEPKRVKEKSR